MTGEMLSICSASIILQYDIERKRERSAPTSKLKKIFPGFLRISKC
jgi:hypothetical protein